MNIVALFSWFTLLVLMEVCEADKSKSGGWRVWKRQSAMSEATCPPGSTIAPCTCTVNTSSFGGLPELLCIQPDPSSSPIALDQVLSALASYLDQRGQSRQYARLRLVNSAVTELNQSALHGVQFHYVDIHENNLTTVEEDTFTSMADSLVYLRIQANHLQTVFASLRPLHNLTTLVLNLGVDSVRHIPSNAVAHLPNLRQLVISGVVASIAVDAFVDLPALQTVRILNQLRTVATNAFDLSTNDSSANKTVNLDLSNNQLNETSFVTDFVCQHHNTSITLDLTFNWVRYLPESVFRPFFEANPNNRLLLNNNKFECGRCDSYWLINDTSIDTSQFSANCYMDQEWNLWDYDWSACESTNGPISASVYNTPNLAMLFVVFTCSFTYIYLSK